MKSRFIFLFEPCKPCFECQVLTCFLIPRSITYYGNLLVIASGLSLVGRIGYYLAYGKEGGAGPIPRRSRSKE